MAIARFRLIDTRWPAGATASRAACAALLLGGGMHDGN